MNKPTEPNYQPNELRAYKHIDRKFRSDPNQTARLLTKPGVRFSGFEASTKEGLTFPEDAAHALGTTQALVNADRVEFAEIFLGSTGLESLISNPHFSGVRELALLDCDWVLGKELGPKIGFGLAESHFTGLETLELAALRIGDNAAAAMMNSPVFSNLKHVSLYQIRLTDAIIEPLINSPWWDQLTTLFVCDIKNPATLELLLNAPEPKNLERMCFSGWNDPKTAADLLDRRYGKKHLMQWDWHQVYEANFDHDLLHQHRRKRLADHQKRQAQPNQPPRFTNRNLKLEQNPSTSSANPQPPTDRKTLGPEIRSALKQDYFDKYREYLTSRATQPPNPGNQVKLFVLPDEVDGLQGVLVAAKPKGRRGQSSTSYVVFTDESFTCNTPRLSKPQFESLLARCFDWTTPPPTQSIGKLLEDFYKFDDDKHNGLNFKRTSGRLVAEEGSDFVYTLEYRYQKTRALDVHLRITSLDPFKTDITVKRVDPETRQEIREPNLHPQIAQNIKQHFLNFDYQHGRLATTKPQPVTPEAHVELTINTDQLEHLTPTTTFADLNKPLYATARYHASKLLPYSARYVVFPDGSFVSSRPRLNKAKLEQILTHSFDWTNPPAIEEVTNLVKRFYNFYNTDESAIPSTVVADISGYGTGTPATRTEQDSKITYTLSFNDMPKAGFIATLNVTPHKPPTIDFSVKQTELKRGQH